MSTILEEEFIMKKETGALFTEDEKVRIQNVLKEVASIHDTDYTIHDTSVTFLDDNGIGVYKNDETSVTLYIDTPVVGIEEATTTLDNALHVITLLGSYDTLDSRELSSHLPEILPIVRPDMTIVGDDENYYTLVFNEDGNGFRIKKDAWGKNTWDMWDCDNHAFKLSSPLDGSDLIFISDYLHVGFKLTNDDVTFTVVKNNKNKLEFIIDVSNDHRVHFKYNLKKLYRKEGAIGDIVNIKDPIDLFVYLMAVSEDTFSLEPFEDRWLLDIGSEFQIILKNKWEVIKFG